MAEPSRSQGNMALVIVMIWKKLNHHYQNITRLHVQGKYYYVSVVYAYDESSLPVSCEIEIQELTVVLHV